MACKVKPLKKKHTHTHICTLIFMAAYVLNGQKNINQRILVTDRSELSDRKVYVFVRV